MNNESAQWFRLKILFFALLIVTASPLTYAAVSYAPHLVWKTAESPHFLIHYHQGIEQQVAEVAFYAEAAHDRLSPYFNWQPIAKTHIVLSDRADFPSGRLNPVPENSIRLSLSPPDFVYGEEAHNGWLKLLILHEYAHILHFDKASGGAELIRRIFGRFTLLPLAVFDFPNAAQSNWSTEGLATFLETDQQRGVGRGQSSYYAMLMRMEVVQGLKGVNEINQPVLEWPGDTLDYLYGVYFYNFIRDQYGEDKIKLLIEEYSDNYVPFFVNRNSEQVLGKSLSQLWTEFEAYLQNIFNKQITSISSSGAIEGKQLTHIGNSAHFLRVLGNNAYYIRDDGRSPPYLAKWDATRQQEVRLVDVNMGARFDIHAKSGIMLTQVEVSENTNYFRDLYSLDLNGEKLNRLTHQGRFNYISWHPDGETLAAVHQQAGRFSLQLVDKIGQARDTLWVAPNDVILGAIA